MAEISPNIPAIKINGNDNWTQWSDWIIKCKQNMTKQYIVFQRLWQIKYYSPFPYCFSL